MSLLFATKCEISSAHEFAPDFAMPDSFRNMPGLPHDTPTDRGDWWMQYGSEPLNRLVDRALANNSDLRIATLQIAQAKVRVDQAKAGRLPIFTAPIRAAIQGAVSTSDTQQSSQIGLQGSYRIDVWGEQKSLSESATMQLWRTIFERDNVQRNVIGSVVSAYINFLTIDDGLLAACANVNVANEVLSTIEQRFALGDATAGEIEQQRAMLSSLQAAIPGLENQREDVKTSIARLVGSVSNELGLPESGVDELLLPTVKGSLPSSLLLRRPDIRMVEARLKSANANIEVARARLLPPIDFSAQAGYSGVSLAQLIQPQNLFWSAAASLAVTIFDGGRREGEVALTQSIYEELVEAYRQTVSQAIREVESALFGLHAANSRLIAQKQNLRATQNVYKTNADAYALAAIDLATMLESRRNYQRVLDETQRTKADVLRSYATLSVALGDGAVSEVTPNSERPKSSFNAIDGTVVQSCGSEVSRGALEVEIPGVFHQSALQPLSRDLHARFADQLKARFISAECLGQIEDAADGLAQSWYRVFVAGFESVDAVKEFCISLNRVQQPCRLADALQ